jgi:hypothetical protein
MSVKSGFYRARWITLLNPTTAMRLLGVIGLLLFCAEANEPFAKPGVTQLNAADYAEIYQLYSAYSVALDTGNGLGRVATFTSDGTFSWSESHHVPETMETVLKRTNAYGQKKRPIGGHILTNIHLTPTAEGANGTCYAVLAASKPDANGHFKMSPGFYTDTLVKTPQGWRFKTREFWNAREEAATLPGSEQK